MIQRKKPIRVAIYQPVIPEYRVPLFTALHRRPEINVEVFASMTAPGGPDTPRRDFEFPFHPVKFISLMNGQLAWQAGLHIPGAYEEGDVLVIGGNPRYLSNYPLLMGARRRRLGIVWWGIWHYPNSKRYAVLARKQLLRLSDVILTYSDKEIEELMAEGIAARRLFATNNTISTENIERAITLWPPDRIHRFMKEKDMAGRDYVLYCGRLTPKPELHVVIKALSLLQKKKRIFPLVVIGDGPEKGRLMHYAEELGVDKEIYWLGPIYDQAALAPWFLNAVALVYPGAVGLSIFHAFAYGLPVITHEEISAQLPEFFALRNGYNGLVFRKGEPEDLALKIEDLGGNPERRAYLSGNALRTIKEDYSFHGMVDRFVQAVLAASDFALEKP